ncbi:sugar diacid recognition domain-containing protein [Massilia sp. 9096]|uniref:sugar diacid recognition domain-containing protein n=1 Tax=Massilia sp. 9096 TaxID=1500894 RepID=UPI0005625F36|nr:sugar diacid recognition domain-containing protein [Massilia sp. 9096]
MVNLSPALAHDIVARTMRIIPFNVNVMDARGVILASGDAARVGQLHDGALLALARKATVEVDAASAPRLHGARPGVNLPLMVAGQLCGAVGLSGAPDEVRQFGELVRLTAEMILEQAGLAGELQRDTRYREAFVLNLIRDDPEGRPEREAWARRLGLDLGRTWLMFVLELDAGSGGEEATLAGIQRLQLQWLAQRPDLLCATVSPTEMALLDAFDADPRALETQARRRHQALAALVRDACALPFTLTMGLPLPGLEGAAVSYQSARAAARIGRRRQAQGAPAIKRGDAGLQLSYYDLALPVLLSHLDAGWQADQLRQPMARLARERSSAALRRTLDVWFENDGAAAQTAAALHIHRNTLDYRLRRIEALTGLALTRMENRLLLYVSALLSPPN